MEKKKDEKKFSKKQSSILIAVIVLFAFLITTGILLSNNVKDTYSAGTGTVTFKGANGQTLTTAEYGIPNDGVCTVDSKGYVDPECVVKLANICREISDGESVLGGSTNCSNYTADQVFYKNTVDLFTQPIDINPRKGAYYCRACTSCQNKNCGVTMPENKCYACEVHENNGYHEEYTKAISSERASAITGGTNCSEKNNSYCELKCYGCKLGVGTEYSLQPSEQAAMSTTGGTNCQVVEQSVCNNKPYHCYECITNGVTTYKWSNDHCDACGTDNPNFTIVEDSKCSVSCYKCNANSNIMKWANDGTGDTNCPGGYSQTTTPQSSCVTTRCYKCKANSNIMKWGTNGNGDTNCPGGYDSTTTPQSSCVTTKCYKCKANSNIMKWGTNGNGDTNCPGGYDSTTTPQSSCVTTKCYKCKANSSIMKWGTNGNGDANCPGGYDSTTTPQSSCVTTSACYQCKTDSSIMKWGTNGNGDTNCPGGYNKINNPKSECPPQVIENPKTGTVAIMFAWIIGVIALLYSCFYVVKLNKINQ